MPLRLIRSLLQKGMPSWFIDPGQPSTLDFTPSQAGVYEINCPMRMVYPSYIVVTK